uniref:Uncharacterized protein LOC103334774 n=1 Tax=Rhizophora mucronata TaxID=61149 RepID=A0A2P2J0G3_RHIMU
MNGFNGTCGYNLPAQIGKLVGSSKAAGVNFQSCQAIGTVSATNTNFVRRHPAPANSLNSEDSLLPKDQNTRISSGPLPNSGNQAMEDPRIEIEHRPSWQGLSTQSRSDSGLSQLQKSDLVPPDLNVRFQTPGSPSYTRVDSAQPDLALQL